jgi:hypothetical protein
MRLLVPSAAPRARHPWRLLIAALLLALPLGSAHAGAPVTLTIERLLERFHAQIHPCPHAQPLWHTCFIVVPGTAAQLAEALELLIREDPKVLWRSDWLAGNGVHQVDLIPGDRAWGILELWLTEIPRQRVEGRIAYLTARRW